MPNWNQVLEEIQTHKEPNALDLVRRKYLKLLHKETGRNIIAYYSGMLQRNGSGRPPTDVGINDDDKNSFMATIHQLDRSKGLDLILHTPGGEIAATESIVKYLHCMFKDNFRTIVPQIAMSAGTMIACASKEILMGCHSNLGPIDPQLMGLPANAIRDEFKMAIEQMRIDPASIPAWQAILSKYHPTLIYECQKSIEWGEEIVKEWLISCMFKDKDDAETKATHIVKCISDHDEHKAHGRHLHFDYCESIGLKVTKLESLDRKLRDLILTVHHTYMHTFGLALHVNKIVENHNGVAKITVGSARPEKPRD